MECLIHSPAFNNVEMAWVAGVGPANVREEPDDFARVEDGGEVRPGLLAGGGGVHAL